MASFNIRLLVYFAAIAIAPVGAAFFGFDALSQRQEAQRVETRLRADVRYAVTGYAQQLDTAERRAQALPLAVAAMRLRTGVDPRDRLVIVRDGRILAGPDTGKTILLSPGVMAKVVLGGTGYRGIVSYQLGAAGNLQFAALAPESEFVSANAASRWRIAEALAGAVLLLALLVYLAGRSIVRTLGRLTEAANAIARGNFHERVRVSRSDEFGRVAAAFNRMADQLEQRIVELEDERRRTRELTARFGNALSATHDMDALLRVFVETVVEATGAEGGLVRSSAGELARAGRPERASDQLELPLIVGGELLGTLILAGPGFDEEQLETATSLVAQVVVALENARLHRVVEWQALVDALTGLANRRALEETLQEEISRARRYGGSLCLVLADLDRFKLINDRYGHPVGDRALREFANTLRGSLRDIDSAGRWGGEEFALILPGTDSAGGVAVADRIRLALAARPVRAPDGEEIPLRASFGVATLRDGGELESLVTEADDALYWAKRQGRDRVVAATHLAGR